MSVTGDMRALVDRAFIGLDQAALARRPLSALKGVSEADNDALRRALGVVTIRDWAEHPAIFAAQAIAAAAGQREDGPALEVFEGPLCADDLVTSSLSLRPREEVTSFSATAATSLARMMSAEDSVALAARAIVEPPSRSAEDLLELSSVTDWLARPEASAALKPEEKSILDGGLSTVNGAMYSLGQCLDSAARTWAALAGQSDTPADRAHFFVAKLLQQLDDGAQRADQARAYATNLHTAASPILDAVRKRQDQGEAQAEECRQKIKSLDRDLDDATRRLEHARDELSGTSGFLHGLVTGLTLGIKNEIQEQIDAANRAIQDINNTQSELRQKQDQIAAAESASQTCVVTLQKLEPLVQAVASLQNAIVPVAASLRAAVNDEQRELAASGEGAVAYYQRKMREEMTGLAAWGGVLQHLRNPEEPRVFDDGTAVVTRMRVLVPRALVASAAPDWKRLYGASQIRAFHLPIPSGAETDESTGYLVQRGSDHTSGLLLSASDLQKHQPAAGNPWIIACDVLRLDVDLSFDRLAMIFARRIEITKGARIVLDQTEDDSGRDLLLYVQELRDDADEPCPLAVSCVRDDQELERVLTLDGSFDAVGLSWPEGGGFGPAKDLEPGYLLDGEALRVFLAGLFQMGLLIETGRPSLVLAQALWISALAKASQSTHTMALQALAVANRLRAQISLPEGTVAVPPLDPEVYKTDLKGWLAVLTDRQRRWEDLSSQTKSDKRWLEQAQVELSDRGDEMGLATGLVSAAQRAKNAAQEAWARAVNNVQYQRAELLHAETRFRTGIEHWKIDETIKASFALLKDSFVFLVKAGSLIGELVVAPGAAAPELAGAASNIASEAQGAKAALQLVESTVDDVILDAGSGSDDDFVWVEEGEGNSTSGKATVKPPQGKTAKKKSDLMAKVGKLAKGAADMPGNAMAIVNDIQRLIAIGVQADALHAMGRKVGDSVDKALNDTWEKVELEGLDVVTGGKQIWDSLEINVSALFEKSSLYKDIDGGPEYRDAFRLLLVAARVLCDTRLAVAAAENRLSEARLRKEMAQRGEVRAKERVAKLSSDITWDQTIAQLVFDRIVDAKRAVYLLSEQYRRALLYYTLNTEDLPPLPNLASSVDKMSAAVNTLTSNVWKLDALDPRPQDVNEEIIHVDAPFTRLPGSDRFSVSFELSPSAGVFAQFGRVRFDRVRAMLSEGSRVLTADMTISLATSGQYTNVVKPGMQMKFVGPPLTRLLEYKASRREPIIDGKLPDGLKELYFKPTPFTLWTAVVEAKGPDGKALDLANARLSLEFKGEASACRV